VRLAIAIADVADSYGSVIGLIPVADHGIEVRDQRIRNGGVDLGPGRT